MNDKGVPCLVLSKTDCCGCGVCSVICPQKAIDMMDDEEGFLYPIIDENKCIRCFLCLDNCILKNRRKIVRE